MTEDHVLTEAELDAALACFRAGKFVTIWLRRTFTTPG